MPVHISRPASAPLLYPHLPTLSRSPMLAAPSEAYAAYTLGFQDNPRPGARYTITCRPLSLGERLRPPPHVK